MDNALKEAFLSIVGCVLRDTEISQLCIDNKEQVKELFDHASSHSILPLVYNKVYKTGAFNTLDSQDKDSVRARSKELVSIQVSKTFSAMRLFNTLDTLGINYVAVKGIICRNTYPEPDLRLSGDEDIYISGEDKASCEEALRKSGLSLIKEKEKESNWFDERTGLHIELHSERLIHLDLSEELDSFFADALNKCIYEETAWGRVKTMEPTSHALYLIVHGLEHFVHSGMGIRQLCDIVMFALKHKGSIDWKHIFTLLKNAKADIFAANLFFIAQDILKIDFCDTGLCLCLSSYRKNYEPLLDDILDAGLFGKSTQDRAHSASLTYNTVASSKKDGFFRALFPSRELLKDRYPILNRKKWPLPFIWIHRIGKYLVSRENSPVKALSIGRKRLDLFRMYGIVEGISDER